MPSAPRSLTLDAGNGRITAAWVAPADPGNPELYGYWIRYRAAGTDEWQYWAQDGTTTVTVISGLTNEETYEVQVAAVNDEGVGAYTGVRRATPQESDRRPGAPRNLNVTAGDRKITVSWSAPEDMGIPALYAYNVYYREGDSGRWHQRFVGGRNALTVTFEHLDNGQTYWVRVAAQNDLGEGPSAGRCRLGPEQVRSRRRSRTGCPVSRPG